MMLRQSVALSALVSLAMSLVPIASATGFPDVPSDHPYASAIRQLALTQVIRGRDDGKFHPEDSLNRADFLLMMYRGLGRTVSTPEGLCMNDVTPGAYYEAVVCHALKQRFVNGYPDKSFKPGNPVSRAEAVTMLMKVMEFDMTLRVAKDTTMPSLTDVPAGEWFTAPVRMAYAYGILPLKGWEGTALHPGKPMTRAEAAALIWSGLQARERMIEQQKSSTASESSVASSMSSDSAGSSESSSVSSASSSSRSAASSSSRAPVTAPVFKSVSFPFTDEQGGRNVTHEFKLSTKTTVDIVVSQTDGRGPATCVLSALNKDGFSLEYYAGYREGRTCYLHVTLLAGTYQLRTQTPDVSARFTVSGQAGKTTGNDGFSEAKDLAAKPVRTEWMNIDDLQDFYSFTVSGLKKGEEGKSMTLKLISEGLTCTVFPMANVDLNGFNGPTCNTAYLYPAGDYVVVIGRDTKLTPKDTKQTYTVQLQK